MMARLLLATLAVLLGSAAASAQTLTGDRIRLNAGPCVIRSGSGTPEGTVVGSPCDEWHRTDTSQIYKKVSGTATPTGWYPTLGPTSATCTTFAGCVAARLTLDTTVFTQQLRSDPSFQLQQYVNTDGAHLNAFNGGGWMPLKLSAGPVQIVGGGLHVGGADTLAPGLGNLDVDGHVGLPGYESQTTGWRIDGLGAADFRYLYTDELHARKFIADLEQALAGLQIIAKSVGQTGAPFTVPAPGSISTLTMKDLPSAANMAIFEAGDYVWIRTFSRASGSLSITNAYGTVTGYTDLADGLQTWQFTRLIANGGAMATATVVEVDAIVLDVGIPGSGWVETNAIDGLYGINSPYTQTVTWSGNSPIAANQALRTRLGNLRGVTGVTGEYGLIAGTYAATNGTYLRASNTAFELHGIDVKLWSGTTNVYRVDHATPYESMGNPAPTAYGTGTGCWSGLDSGVFKWRCGDIAGGTNYIAWNGSTLEVVGAITVEGTLPDADNALALVGVAGATVVSGAARGTLGLDATGNPVLPAAATPSGTGLFLGSDKLGFYTASAWKTYMDNAGNFYLGGTGGALQWNGTALVIAATLSGNGAAITSISGGNITTGSVTATQIATGTITATQIAAGTITASQIAANTITSANILAGTIVASDIAAGTITGTQIAAGTISATEIAVSSLAALSATLGAVQVGSNGNIRQGQTAYNTGTGWWIGDDAGTPRFSIGNSAGNRVTWDGSTLTLVGEGAGINNLTGGNIIDGSVTVNELAANSVTSAKIVAGAITADKMTVTSLDAIAATLGSVTVGSGGAVRQGQTAYHTGTGFWIGDVSGTPKFSIGNSAGNYMTWDGATLTINAVSLSPITSVSSPSSSGGGVFSLNNAGNNYRTIYWTSGTTYGAFWSISNPVTNGHQVVFQNGSSGSMSIRCDTGGTATINIPGVASGSNLSLAAGKSITLVYDSSSTRWLVTVQP